MTIKNKKSKNMSLKQIHQYLINKAVTEIENSIDSAGQTYDETDLPQIMKFEVKLGLDNRRGMNKRKSIIVKIKCCGKRTTNIIIHKDCYFNTFEYFSNQVYQIIEFFEHKIYYRSDDLIEVYRLVRTYNDRYDRIVEIMKEHNQKLEVINDYKPDYSKCKNNQKLEVIYDCEPNCNKRKNNKK